MRARPVLTKFLSGEFRKPLIALFSAALLLRGLSPLGAEAPGSADILAAIDSFRSLGGSGYSCDFATIEDSGEASLMRVSVRLSGSEAALVKYLEPARQRGRVVLVRGNAFWLYEPGMKSAIRISPRQILFGQASAGDVSRISFRSTYELLSSEASEGGYRLRLKAKPGAGATYDLVDLRTGADYRPTRAECRGSSGTLMKTINYQGYETIGGRSLLTSFTIRDEVNGKSTRVRLGAFDPGIPPESTFSVQALKHYK
jgi:outer membrane lipoprotein-sorting protein